MPDVSRIPLPASGRVLVFGPQSLAVSEKSLIQLRTALIGNADLNWLSNILQDISCWWQQLSETSPVVRNLGGQETLSKLSDFFETGRAPDLQFPLSSIVLTPVVVASQLVQYSRFSSLSPFTDQQSSHRASQLERTEALGFCTGLLSAFASSSSPHKDSFRHNGAVAIHLAALIGAFVDSHELDPEFQGASTSVSAAWQSKESRDKLLNIVESHEGAYVSVIYDENRMNITVSQVSAPSLAQSLRAAGLSATEFSLRGRFHDTRLLAETENLIQLCDSRNDLQFVRNSQFAIPIRDNRCGDYLDGTNLHRQALVSILGEQCQWHQTFERVYNSKLLSDDSVAIVFGTDRCVPPSIARRMGSRLVYAADQDLAGADSARVGRGPLHDASMSEAIDQDDDIVVVGMSCKVAGADDVNEFWEILCKGQSQHQEVPEHRFSFDTVWREKDPNRKWYGNFINDYDTFDHKFFKKSPREMMSTDPQQRWMLQVAYQAVEQSGYFQSQDQDKHIGCYIGIGCDDYEHNIACHPANAYSATGNLRSFAAGKISHHFGWTGPGLTIDTACSASAVAIHQACKSIQCGDCTSALAGGVTIMTNPLWFQNLAGASFLSTTGNCKTFDAGADGYCRGEGIAAVFLKKRSTALANGDQILGVIRSTAVYQNQNCTPITVPNAPSLSQLFGDVTRKARLGTDQITVVEAHGTGTPVGDPAEYDSVRQVFGGPHRTAGKVHLGSVKGFIGHTETASGVVSLIKTLLMIQHRTIPPQASFTSLNPIIKASSSDNIEVTKTLQPWKAPFRAALINNYGASGSNASLVVSQETTSRVSEQITPPRSRQPFWLCGADESSLRSNSKRLRALLSPSMKRDEPYDLADLSFNAYRQSNRTLTQAAIFSCKTTTELVEKLKQIEDSPSTHSAVTAASRPVVLCFGGQVSRSVGLQRAVYESVTVLREHLDRCDATCRALEINSIYPGIFQSDPVEDPVQLQTMLFALQYSCAMAWIDCGVKPVALIGHSFGELTAICVSGAMSLHDSLTMISRRAAIIRDSWGPEKGAMMAVESDIEVVEQALDEANSDEEDTAANIACYNGTRSFTLAGSASSIDRLANVISKDDKYSSSMRFKKLNVGNAFHSQLVEPLMGDLSRVTQSLEVNEPAITLEHATKSSSSTSRIAPNFVAEHLRSPVYFNEAIQRLAKEHKDCIWLEAGSNSTITSMASRALGSPKRSHFQAINITKDEAMNSLADSTATLWKEGLQVTFWPHHKSQTKTYQPIIFPAYEFAKTRHWMDLKKPSELVITQAVPQEAHVPDAVWSFHGYTDRDQRNARFKIHTSSQVYQEYVAGHTIAQAAPLCPSTFQVDLAIEALRSSQMGLGADKHAQQKVLSLENHSPLCLDSSRTVWLDLNKLATSPQRYTFAMVSYSQDDNKVPTLHVSGILELMQSDDSQVHSDFARFSRLVSHEQCLNLLNDPNAVDGIQGRNIYRTFAEIVDYGQVYRGLQKIVGGNNQSAAKVVMKYSGKTWLDTPLADCFCQCAGIFVNCMTDRADSEMFISNKIEQWIRNPAIDLTEHTSAESWDVFAIHRRLSDKEYLSDVFVFEPHTGVLVELILGIGYQRVSKLGMGKMLRRLTPAMNAAKDQSSNDAPSNTEVRDVEVEHTSPSKAFATSPKGPEAPASSSLAERIRDLLSNVSGLEPSEIKDSTALADIGIDSLMGMELAREIEIEFKCSLDMEELNNVEDFKSLMVCIEGALGVKSTSQDEQQDSDSKDPAEKRDDNKMNNGIVSDSATDTKPLTNGVTTNGHLELSLPEETVLNVFEDAKRQTDDFVRDNKFSDYVKDVLPRQTQLCIAYIVEAFEKMGCSLRKTAPTNNVPRLHYHNRHEKMVKYLFMLLSEEANLVEKSSDDDFVRTTTPMPTQTSEEILRDLITRYPDHANDHKLIELTGSKLSNCLTGETDGVQVIFGSSESRDLVAALYGKSPINMVWLNQMRSFIRNLVEAIRSQDGCLKIIELGAGTGGTTAILAPLLAEMNAPVEYTFTDLSPSLVAGARKRFKHYPFMRFQVHDIEKPATGDLKSSQHIAISNNCVHATHNLSESTGNIRSVLRPDGFLMIQEMTKPIYWVDIVFGLLEGWWLFDDGREHVVAPESFWKKSLLQAGFGQVEWTDGERPEASLQRIIIAMASESKPEVQPLLPTESNGTADCAARQRVIDEYVNQYTKDFRLPPASQSHLNGHVAGLVVLITGATGSLGSHLVAHLANMSEVSRVICLNRKSAQSAALRQQHAIKSRGIKLTETALSKLETFQTDTSQPDLGLTAREYKHLVTNVTSIVHNAWPMSIKRTIKGFEGQFQAMRNLLDLAGAISSSRPSVTVDFQFVSSIATVGYYPLWTKHARVPETPMDARSVLPSGYGDAKLVCEHMLDRTLHRHSGRFRAMAVRVGQIAGSRTSGYWNPVEHFSFLIKSSQSLGALPDLQGNLSWCPVTDVAAALSDMILLPGPRAAIMHIENPVRQPWPPMIRTLETELGLGPVGVLPIQEWVERVRQSAASAETDNPAAKLADFLDDHFERMSCGGLILDTTRAVEASPSLAAAKSVDESLVGLYVRSWRESGFLR